MNIAKDAVIRIAVEKNPKRPGTAAHRHFQRFRDGMTVGEYRELGPWATVELRHSLKRGHIRLEPAMAPSATPMSSEAVAVTT